MSEQKSTGYNAQSVESKWYAAWQKAGLFEPESGEKPVYSITIPPPNITGSLHMGHALCYGIQDLLGRYKRMTGYKVLILPGQDHAGIATQSVVLKNLKKQGVNPANLSRDTFVEKAWEWRKESGDTILDQFRALGCAFDWSRLRFTLDDHYHAAVLKVFIDWFEKGLIYRGMRVVNWDIALQTSVSDIETERKDVSGHLYHIRYRFKDGSGSVTIATTRPETMLADVAVAVNPKDKRYHGLVGKTLILPLLGREIPLIADDYADPEFGTGAVKITPAHDANDFEVGERHGLPLLIMMDGKGIVTEVGGPYEGMDRLAARKKIVEDLEQSGALVQVENHTIPIIISQRSNEVIEPLASEQWFVDQKTLAQKAIQVVEDGQINFHPDRYKEVYLDWLHNIKDWCISRQLWWGHRIPVYYTEDGAAYAAASWEEAQEKAGNSKIVRQDDDVLDTWFSSGLWPFATLGWPDQSPDLADFYPTDVLVTARDIIYLWVARMIMMGTYFVKEIPFKDVYIYATVLTEDGKRMSKSLGTGVDPMDIISSKGADALRYTLMSQTGMNQDLRYSDRKTDEARNFCNKMWNASRFVLLNLDGYNGEIPDHLDDIDRWLLSRLAECEETVRRAYDSYDLQAGMNALYRFFWNEVCDWYIEICKRRLQDPKSRLVPQYVLLKSLHEFLRMMHPAMPHITEEIYSILPIPNKRDFLMRETWPDIPSEWRDPATEEMVERWLEVTRAARALRAEFGFAALKPIEEAYYEGDLKGGEYVVSSQAWITNLKQGKPSSKHVSITSNGIDFHLPIEGLIDTEKECERLEKELVKFNDELSKLQARLSNPQFVERAKPEIVQREQEAAAALEEKIKKTQEWQRLFGCL
ncbi:valine--tRNA ligase [Geitlerinema splendidum]|nr:valine--tRNA ligase [Geitlerinema splendidum]